ncbi:DnaJ like protein subfamily C member 9 [Strigomonas culicis]|uniref:DnaJ like protein subfamily C member 9 n=1 Tax=Strigomonas culicis TaxID=28005 RepID=S9W4S1_9TRYP|nr:DnaJ like protein subfamily C member 9 [Strigomonas culicis]|eukprot:EPY30880.1 DnaJ like protein subfamily C member 9 [Strigomonas culicis]
MVLEQLLFDNGEPTEVRRLRQVVQRALAAGQLEASELWVKSATDKAVQKLERALAEERAMAEETLREMGVDGKAAAGREGEGSLVALQALMRQRQAQAHASMLDHLQERYVKQPREQRVEGKRGREEKSGASDAKRHKAKK